MGPSGAWEVQAALEQCVMLDHLGGTRHSEAPRMLILGKTWSWGSCWDSLQLKSTGTDRLEGEDKIRNFGGNFIWDVHLKLLGSWSL